MSEYLLKEQIIKELECSICGSYDNLSPYNYAKSYSKTTNSGYYRTTTTRTKSILVPLCDECNANISKNKKRKTIIITLLIFWILALFPLLFFIDITLFWDLQSVAIFGILVLIIPFVALYTNSYYPQTFVKFASGMYDNRTFLFSRKKGEWILYDTWLKSSINNRAKMANLGIPAFPKKNTFIWKSQYIGSLLCLISILFPYSIYFSPYGNYISLSWLAGFYIEINGGVITSSSLFSSIFYSFNISIIITNILFFLLIGTVSFYNLRNCTFLKKSEKNIKIIEKDFLKYGIGEFLIVIGYYIMFIVVMYLTDDIDILSFIFVLRIQFIIVFIGAGMILLGYYLAKKENFYEDNIIDATPIEDTFQYSTHSPEINQKSHIQSQPQTSKIVSSHNDNVKKFCGVCGERLIQGDKFCRSCGSPI